MTANLWIFLLPAAVAAYLLGSIPSGFLAGRMRGIDIRKEGSGNIGATNALRVLGKKVGYAVFAADFLKGFLGVRAAVAIGAFGGAAGGFPGEVFGVTGAVFVVVGHMFPVWLGFNGGKGIATSGGVILALFPWQVFAAGLGAWLVLFFTTRIVSVASLAAALALPGSSLAMRLAGAPDCGWLLVGAAALMCALAVWRHRPNIQRLLAGTEKRFERKKPTQGAPG